MEPTPVLEALRDLQTLSDLGVCFVNERGKIKRVAYGELIERSRGFAGGLLHHNVMRGEPVILVMTHPEAAVIAILGCLIAGCPPTPIYPPQNLAGVPLFQNFVRHVAERSRAGFVVANAQPYAVLGSIPHVRGAAKFESVAKMPASLELSGKTENPVAFLQFTSGSTSVPRGVIVTQEGLASNLQMIRHAARMDRGSCVVTWLPVYHDMGLIGTVLNAITLPCELVVLPPMLFLKRPRLWLELISEFKGTHTAAPNFAYGLCVKRVADVEGLDLSSMTTFICGAEPVLPKTIEAFVRHYRPAGLHPGALVPAYGLAEATLAVSFSPFLRGLATDTIDLESLSLGFAEPADSHGQQIPVASCGLPMVDLTVRVATEKGEALPERRVGEIQIKGPTVTSGYVGDETATRQSKTDDGFLRTGDLGYFAGGELFVCGRIKDVIIIRGKNYHAHDLESLASEIPGVRTGNVVAFGRHQENGESLVIVAETRSEGRERELARQIQTHLNESIRIKPDDVLVVPAGTLPKTSSGKLKRSETRLLYERGLLQSKPRKLSALGTVIKSLLRN